jgi:UDP-N-acetylmuramoyl-tripeptide--D-alanyl-D-alanine ligase
MVMDSRLVQKDYIFLASVGERVDGHNYIDEVFEKSALAVICEKAPVHPKGPYILVDNSLQALKDIAAWYRTQLNIKVVGITGSVGKTSTKEFISSVLARKYKVLKTEGNYNNEIGLPLTILKITGEHEVAVLEMGISNFGEMHRLSKIAQPDICVITNIGQCHLENLGSRQGILKAKSEIFDFMNEDGRVCINGDDDMLATLQEIKGRKPVRFGLHQENDITGSDIVSKGLFGSSCTIHIGEKAYVTEVPLPGSHMVLNALAATAVGTLLDVAPDQIVEGIKAVKPVGGRSNIIRHEQHTIIDDCYNANPVSMKAALDLLSMADTRKVALLGDMGELGIDEEKLHKDVGEYAVSSGVDLLVCVGKLSRNMSEGAKAILEKGNDSLIHHPEVLYFETRDALIDALPDILKNDDTVLVKASHFMGFEHVVSAIH